MSFVLKKKKNKKISCCVNGCSNHAGGSVELGFYIIPIIRLHECEKTKLLSEYSTMSWLLNVSV